MKADEQTTNEVLAVIARMSDAYKSRNIRELMTCFVPDDDAVLIGTSAEENRMGSEQIRRQAESDWATTDSIEMAFTPVSISAAGQVAWAFLDGTFKIQAGGQSMELPARVSTVLEKRDNNWLITHAHFSTPGEGETE